MDPREIFRSDKLLEFWPTATQSAKDRTAATTRFIVYAMCILYLIKRDARILALRQRIDAVGDATLTDPLRRWRSVVEIKLKNGRKITGQTLAAKGTFENPLTRPEVEEKALDLMVPIIGKARSVKLMNALFDVEKIRDMRSLRRIYAA